MRDSNANGSSEVTEPDDEPEVDDIGEDDDEDCVIYVGQPDFRRPTKRQSNRLTKLYGSR